MLRKLRSVIHRDGRAFIETKLSRYRIVVQCEKKVAGVGQSGWYQKKIDANVVLYQPTARLEYKTKITNIAIFYPLPSTMAAVRLQKLATGTAANMHYRQSPLSQRAETFVVSISSLPIHIFEDLESMKTLLCRGRPRKAWSDKNEPGSQLQSYYKWLKKAKSLAERS